MIIKFTLSLLLIFTLQLALAQELPRAVKKINPSLFINNIENERVYQQANIRENLVVFSHGFKNRSIEEIQQSFHYLFLDTKEQTWLLELQFVQHDIKIPGKGFSNSLGVNDFGFKIYHKKEETWKEVTLKSIPSNFISHLLTQLPELMQGSSGLYFYNQEPKQVVIMAFEKNKLSFIQNGCPVLTLLWKRNTFIWR